MIYHFNYILRNIYFELFSTGQLMDDFCSPQDNLPMKEPAEKVDTTDDAEVKYSHVLRKYNFKCL